MNFKQVSFKFEPATHYLLDNINDNIILKINRKFDMNMLVVNYILLQTELHFEKVLDPLKATLTWEKCTFKNGTQLYGEKKQCETPIETFPFLCILSVNHRRESDGDGISEPSPNGDDMFIGGIIYSSK